MKSLTSHVRDWVCSSVTERLGGSVFLILVCTNLYKIRSIKGIWRVCPVTSISSGYGCRIFSFRCLGPSFYKWFPFCLKTVLPAQSSDIGKDREHLIVETAPCLSHGQELFSIEDGEMQGNLVTAGRQPCGRGS